MLKPGFPAISLAEARVLIANARVWAITDGKMGDIAQCLGVAERLGLVAENHVVKPRAPFTWLMPWGPIDPADAPGRMGSPITPPFPDIAIASGRRAVPYLRHVKRASGGLTTTLFLKDPRSGAGTADLLWVPEHDRLRGDNVIVTPTSPHRVSPERLAEARALPTPWDVDQRPVLGVLLGGDSKDFHFTVEDIGRLCAELEQAAHSGARLIVTPSRRTSPALANAVQILAARYGGWFWDGCGENPYPAILAHAANILVTAESVNMAGEAASTGKPVLLFRPSGSSRKIDQFLRGLEGNGAARPFRGALEDFTYEPMDSTPLIARTLAQVHAARRKMEQIT